MATKTNTQINGQEYYRITRTVGHKLVDGEKKPIKKQFYGTSKGDAEQQYKQYLKQEAESKYQKTYEKDHSTLHDRAKDYIEQALKPSAKYATATKLRYEGAYNTHIKNTWLDRMALKDIHPSDLQRFYNELDVSKSTLKAINKFMSAFYKWIQRNEYGSNIVSSIDMPKKKDTRKHEGIQVWDNESWDLLTSSKFDFRHDFLIKLMSYSGMRISECLGLKYADIRDDSIYVSRQYYEGEIKEPKYNSKRDIPMHPRLIESFEIHKAWHEEEMYKNGYQTEFVFTTVNGTLYDIANLRRAFHRFYNKQNIPIKEFHTYRATFCTKLCEAGAPLEVASKILGHKSLEVTAQHYALVRHDTKKDAIAMLE